MPMDRRQRQETGNIEPATMPSRPDDDGVRHRQGPSGYCDLESLGSGFESREAYPRTAKPVLSVNTGMRPAPPGARGPGPLLLPNSALPSVDVPHTGSQAAPLWRP